MDKREAVRVPVSVRAQCRCNDVIIDGLVEDLSRSGLFLRSPKWLRAGTEAEVDLDVPGESPLHLCAEVVRVEHGPDRAGMALRIVTQPENGKPLANFIMRHHASAR